MAGRQDIRFCTSADGARLAVATVGQGLPLVRAATWLTHVEKDADNLCNRHWVEEMSRDHFYVRYDSRGCGLSDRDVERFSRRRLDRRPRSGHRRAPTWALFSARHVAGAAIAGRLRSAPPRAGEPPRDLRRLRARVAQAQPSPEAWWTRRRRCSRPPKSGWGADSSSFRQVFISQLFHDASAEQQRAFDEAQRPDRILVRTQCAS